MLKYIKKYKFYILIALVPYVVCYGWRWLEFLIYGQPEYRVVDDIVGLILIISISLNIILFKCIKDIYNYITDVNKKGDNHEN